MPAPGIPPQMEYHVGDSVPSLLNERGGNVEATRWRCMQCGESWEAHLGRDVMFPNCFKCSGSRWGFSEAVAN